MLQSLISALERLSWQQIPFTSSIIFEDNAEHYCTVGLEDVDGVNHTKY